MGEDDTVGEDGVVVRVRVRERVCVWAHMPVRALNVRALIVAQAPNFVRLPSTFWLGGLGGWC